MVHRARRCGLRRLDALFHLAQPCGVIRRLDQFPKHILSQEFKLRWSFVVEGSISHPVRDFLNINYQRSARGSGIVGVEFLHPGIK